MLTMAYQIIVVCLDILIILDIWDEVDYWKLLTGVMVMIPCSFLLLVKFQKWTI